MEGFGKLKKSTSSGFEPASFRIVTQCPYSNICREEMSKPANSSKGILHKRKELKLWFPEHERRSAVFHRFVHTVHDRIHVFYLLVTAEKYLHTSGLM
jgi:hypothetical protein